MWLGARVALAGAGVTEVPARCRRQLNTDHRAACRQLVRFQLPLTPGRHQSAEASVRLRGAKPRSWTGTQRRSSALNRLLRRVISADGLQPAVPEGRPARASSAPHKDGPHRWARLGQPVMPFAVDLARSSPGSAQEVHSVSAAMALP